MKTYIPIIYGVAISSVVAFYVFKHEPNKLNKDDKQSTVDATPASEKTIQVSANPLISQANNHINPDANVHYGIMDNGMKYIILKNSKPEKRVSMRLHVGAGSLNENENQRGIAHFLEHMVFNGSKNYPDAKKLIPKMQRLGISFGAHANAYTSFDETVYMLDLPNIKEDTLNLAFSVMQDFAGGALLEESEIDEERGVISSEKTSRDSVGMRIMEQQFQAILPESLVSKRFPIGTEEVIQNSQRKQFTDFYTQFYRPKNMCFVYVGDIDPTEAEARIKETFGSLTEPANPGAAPSVGKITTGRGFQTAVFADKELSSTDISLTQVKKHQFSADTASNRAARLPLIIANQILSKRFRKISLQENSPILSGSSYRQVLFKELEIGSVDVTAKNNDWKAALPILLTEQNRAIQHGFTEKELNEAKASLLTSYKLQVKNKASRKSPDLASSLTQHHHNNRVFSTPETDLKIVEEALSNISTDVCHSAYRSFWSTNDIHLTLTTQNKEPDLEKTLASQYQQLKTKSTEAPEIEQQSDFAYTDFGKAGTITSSTELPDLAITQLLLSNGIRVNLKQTDFEANNISLVAHFGHGKLSQPKSKPGIDQFASTVMNAGGLGKHSTTDLQSILAGKSVGLGFSIADDSFQISGSSSKDDLELQLQLLAASFSDSGFRPEGARIFKAQLPQLASQLKHTPAGGQNQMTKTLTANDPRFAMPATSELEKLTIQDVKDWIQPSLNNDHIELSIIGDFNRQELQQILLKTIGAIPTRPSNPSTLAGANKLNATSFPLKETHLFDSKVPTAMAIDAWRIHNIKTDNASTPRRLNILSKILGDRMRIKLREELGQAYSPGATARTDQTFTNHSYILAFCPGKPSDVANLSQTILDLAENLATNGATQDELNRALTPQLASLKKSKKSNGYWLNTVMAQSQSKPYKLEWSRNRDQDYNNIKLDEINALAKEILLKQNAAQFIIKPK